MRFSRIEQVLNCVGILASSRDRCPVRAPILEEHGNGRRAAAFFSLFDEGNIEPHTRGLLGTCRRDATEQERECSLERDASYDRDAMSPCGFSADGQCDDQNRDDDQNNPQQVAVGEVAGGKVFLRSARFLRKRREILVAELADGLVHFL